MDDIFGRLFSAGKAAAKEAIKKKIMLFIIANLPIIGQILIGVILVAILAAPVLTIMEKVSDYAGSIAEFFTKNGNPTENRSFLNSDNEKIREVEDKMRNKASDIYNNYNNNRPNVKLDMALIISTIYYPVNATYEEATWTKLNEGGSSSNTTNSGTDDLTNPNNVVDYINENMKHLDDLARHMVRTDVVTYSCKAETYIDDKNVKQTRYVPDKFISTTEYQGDDFPDDVPCTSAKSEQKKYSFSIDYDKYDNYLVDEYLPTYKEEYDIPLGLTGEDLKNYLWKIVNGIHDLADIVRETLGMETSGYIGYYGSCGGNCDYNIKGYRNGDQAYDLSEPLKVSDLKVQLLECYSDAPIANEELVDFEKYILGVVYAENGGGSAEALKVQAITARSYALIRPYIMGGAGGRSLSKENGQWILKIKNCTVDQVYCDPDKGCWSDSDSAGSTVHSGTKAGAAYSRPALNNSDTRRDVQSVLGKIILDKDGRIVNAPYTSVAQTAWNDEASKNEDYTAILVNYYKGYSWNIQIGSPTCTSTCAAEGDFTNWKQTDKQWANVKLGSSTVGEIGCTATSVAIQIARSGTEVTISPFNPGNFVYELMKRGGFSGNSFDWRSPSNTGIAPHFIFKSFNPISGSPTNKLNQIQSYIDKGCYLVLEVKDMSDGTSQHWVAIDRVADGILYMFDPSSSEVDLWKKYKYTKEVSYSNDLACYKVE